MSKLSPALKALISAAHAKPNTIPAPPQIRGVYEKLWKDAQKNNVGTPAWLTMSVCITLTPQKIIREGGLTMRRAGSSD